MAKISFIQPQTIPYSGMYYLAGAVRHGGHAYSICVDEDYRVIRAHVEQHAPDLLGVSSMTGLHVDHLYYCRALKRDFPQLPIVMGGPHPTYEPEVLDDPGLDMICRGEGERPLVALLDAIDRGETRADIPNFWFKDADGRVHKNELAPLLDPLDQLPPGDYGIYDHVPAICLEGFPKLYVGRGCPFTCSYCHISSDRELFKGLGPRVRWFSPERIIEEVRAMLPHYPKSRVFWLGAETWGAELEFFEEVLERFHAAFPIPYALNMRPELVRPRTVEILKKTGCHMVAWGIEAGSERVRREIMGRNYRNEQVERAAALLHEAGIPFRTYNIVGVPTETAEELMETVHLNQRIGTAFPYISILVPYPGTKIYDYCRRHDLLKPGFTLEDMPPSFNERPVIRIPHERLTINVHRFFHTLVLWPWTEPLVSLLMKLPDNWLFRAWYLFTFALLNTRAERRSWRFIVRAGLKNLRFYFRPRRGPHPASVGDGVPFPMS